MWKRLENAAYAKRTISNKRRPFQRSGKALLLGAIIPVAAKLTVRDHTTVTLLKNVKVICNYTGYPGSPGVEQNPSRACGMSHIRESSWRQMAFLTLVSLPPLTKQKKQPLAGTSTCHFSLTSSFWNSWLSYKIWLQIFQCCLYHNSTFCQRFQRWHLN